ncbi:MAG: TonB-dependent receptor [Gammaproteobacteria bacterium]
MRNRLFLTILFLSFMNYEVIAEDSGLIENLIITAAKSQQLPNEIIVPIIVIDQSDIELSGVNNIAELLSFVNGINISINGGPGQLTSIFVQGSNSNQVLILVDGIAINDSATGIAAIQNIHPDMVERIEIVKSPRASLYGSNAVGGVINIFTKRDLDRTTLGFKYGSDKTQIINISTGSKTTHGKLGLHFNDYDTDGFPSQEASNINSKHNNRSINGFYDGQWDKTIIKASILDSRGTTDYLDFFANPISQDFNNTTFSFNLNQEKNEVWKSNINFGLSKDFLDQNNSNDFNHSKNVILEWKNNFSLNKNNELLAGITLENEQFDASNYSLNIHTNLNNKALFLENIFSNEKNQFLVAIRFNHKEGIDDKMSWNLEYGHHISPNTRLLLNAGKAFRNPSSFDLYGFGGNTLLQPEYSEKISLGLSYQPNSSTNIDLHYFDNRVKDLIAFNYLDFKLYNIERSKTSGIDLNLQTTINKWILNLNATLQDPENLTTSTQLLRRPKNSFGIGVRRSFEKLTFNLSLAKNSSRNDFGGVVLDAYTLANLSIRYQLNNHWTFNSSINNLNNEEYTLANGYVAPDRKIYFGFMYSPRG